MSKHCLRPRHGFRAASWTPREADSRWVSWTRRSTIPTSTSSRTPRRTRDRRHRAPGDRRGGARGRPTRRRFPVTSWWSPAVGELRSSCSCAPATGHWAGLANGQHRDTPTCDTTTSRCRRAHEEPEPHGGFRRWPSTTSTRLRRLGLPAGPHPDVGEGRRRPGSRQHPGWGPPTRRWRPVAHHSVNFWLCTEDLPRADNRVTLGPDGEIHLALDETNNVEGLRRLRHKLDCSVTLAVRTAPPSGPQHLPAQRGCRVGNAHQAGTVPLRDETGDVRLSIAELDNST